MKKWSRRGSHPEGRLRKSYHIRIQDLQNPKTRLPLPLQMAFSTFLCQFPLPLTLLSIPVNSIAPQFCYNNMYKQNYYAISILRFFTCIYAKLVEVENYKSDRDTSLCILYAHVVVKVRPNV